EAAERRAVPARAGGVQRALGAGRRDLLQLRGARRARQAAPAALRRHPSRSAEHRQPAGAHRMAAEAGRRLEEVLRHAEVLRRAKQDAPRDAAIHRLQDRRHAGNGSAGPLHGERRTGRLARGDAANGRLSGGAGPQSQVMRIVITGASSGIGAALARYYASDDSVLGLIARDRKSTRLNSSHLVISYAVFRLKKKQTSRQDKLPAASVSLSFALPFLLRHSWSAIATCTLSLPELPCRCPLFLCSRYPTPSPLF